MPVKTIVIKDFPNGAKLRRSISNVVSKSAKDFKNRTRIQMIEQTPTGTLYEKAARGRGFTRSHRASRPGQRPQPDTLTLSSAIRDKRNAPFSSTVDIAHRINPENGADAHDYAERLVEMDRIIFSDGDVRVAQFKFDFDLDRAINKVT